MFPRKKIFSITTTSCNKLGQFGIYYASVPLLLSVNMKNNINRLLSVPNAVVLLNHMILQSSSLDSTLLKVKHTISSFPQVKPKVGYWIT